MVFAHVRHFDDVLDFSRLLFNLGGEEERSRSYRVPREVGERVEDVEAVHVHYRGVDA